MTGASARRLDAADPLAGFLEEFHIPEGPRGSAVYLCGNSLGLQPRGVRELMRTELDSWARLGVRGHFEGPSPWFPYHEGFRDSGARLVGARPGEVVMMNSLTANLHLMMASFYRPEKGRFRILVDEPCFPSDAYAVRSQAAWRGFDPERAVLAVRPRPGEDALRAEDVEALLEREGRRIALVLMSGVNFLTGQVLDMRRLTAAARGQGCVVGWDLAHAAGNIPLRLHDWGVDFAVWCSYKYLNAGPGAIAGCFVHERHGRNARLPRLAGWWGNDPKTRFKMLEEFIPRPGADGWQLSNPPILAAAPLRASLALFDKAGMGALRRKSERLTGCLQSLLDRIPRGRLETITPRDPAARGCQISLRILKRPRQLVEALEAEGFVCDFRAPDILRAAPVPLYNTFRDVWRFARALERLSQ